MVGSGTGSGKFSPDTDSDPDPNLSVLWLCKVVKTRKKYFNNRGFTHFQVNFSIFSDKNNYHSNIRRNMFDVKKNLMFELILKVPEGSGIRFKKSDLLDPDPEPAKNGPDPKPCPHRFVPERFFSHGRILNPRYPVTQGPCDIGS